MTELSTNQLGTGRAAYYPATEGRLNVFQIRAAVWAAGHRRVWRIPLIYDVHQYLGASLPDFDVPPWHRGDGYIKTSVKGVMFNNGLTLPTDEGLYLIEIMKWFAQARRDYWDKTITRLPWDPIPPVTITLFAAYPGAPYYQLHKNGNGLCAAEWTDKGWIFPDWSVRSLQGHGYDTLEAMRSDLSTILSDTPRDVVAPHTITLPQEQPDIGMPRRTEAPRESSPDHDSGRDLRERHERIDTAVKSFSGRRLKKSGWPYVTDLRRWAKMPDISTTERNERCRQLES